MRTLTAISLLFTLAFPFALKTAILGNYWINRTYYANVLCENKDKPEMACNGQCQLGKELKVTEASEERSQLPSFPSLKVELSFFEVKQPELLSPPSETGVVHSYPRQYFIPEDCSGEIFHPPQA